MIDTMFEEEVNGQAEYVSFADIKKRFAII
jgi:hypothetical protein